MRTGTALHVSARAEAKRQAWPRATVSVLLREKAAGNDPSDPGPDEVAAGLAMRALPRPMPSLRAEGHGGLLIATSRLH
jgi:hypothetical protein